MSRRLDLELRLDQGALDREVVTPRDVTRGSER
jgi:hypothetical protein